MDTDMKVLKSFPKEILENEMFLGYEENYLANAAIVGAKDPRNKNIADLKKLYDKFNEFNEEIIWNYAIPTILTKYLGSLSARKVEDGVLFDCGKIRVYDREFFYPINYDFSEKGYTENSVAVHLYKASWTDKSEKTRTFIRRIFGDKLANIFFKVWWTGKDFIKKIVSRLTRAKRNRIDISYIEKSLSNDSEYCVFSHPEWLGVTNVARDSFENIIYMKEIPNKKTATEIAKLLVCNHKRVVIFNGFPYGWKWIVQNIKSLNPDITVKVLWHGSDAQLVETYSNITWNEVLQLHNAFIIDEIGFVKKSQEEFYRRKGYRTSFFANSVVINNPEEYKTPAKDESVTRIGIYSSASEPVTEFRKNIYNLIDAASLIDSSLLDIVTLKSEFITFCDKLGISVDGATNKVDRDDLYRRMASNDINLYVTHVECAPILPLESLELGVPCITGDNHHYWEGTELEQYLVCRKPDNAIAIAEQVQIVLENRKKIAELYQKWKIENTEMHKHSVKAFLAIKE